MLFTVLAYPGGMIDDFIERQVGPQEGLNTKLPELEQILKETLGVIRIPGTVMRIANVMGGFLWEKRTFCARPWARRLPEEMAKQRERFVKGALERGFRKRRSSRYST